MAISRWKQSPATRDYATSSIDHTSGRKVDGPPLRIEAIQQNTSQLPANNEGAVAVPRWTIVVKKQTTAVNSYYWNCTVGATRTASTRGQDPDANERIEALYHYIISFRFNSEIKVSFYY